MSAPGCSKRRAVVPEASAATPEAALATALVDSAAQPVPAKRPALRIKKSAD